MRTICLPVAILVSLLATAPLSAAPQAERPNVVFILLDNCGQEWLGCYGSEEGRTPRIDELAKTGVRCEHCYTPPVCGPSRMVLLTGRYLLRSGFTLHHDAGLYSGGGFSPDREIVFSRLFQGAGYATGISGKWQINNLYDEPDALARHGFDEHVVWPGSVDRDQMTEADWKKFRAAILAKDIPGTVAMIQRVESRYWDPVVIKNGERQTLKGRFGPDVYQEFALDFIRRHKDHPFLLYYPMPLTHGQTFTKPVVPTPADLRPDRPHHEMYGDMVAYADRLVGQVIDELEKQGLRERTIVFVATDNGTEVSLAARFRGGEAKGGLYTLTEAGGSVALMANWPGKIAGGRTVPLADFSDVLPTMCDLAGIAAPSDRPIDGRSLAPYLLGKAAAPPREWIFNQYGPRRVIRDRRFKLYSTGELFDAEADRAEERNLAASNDPAATSAKERLGKLLAAMPPDNPPPFELRSQTAFKLFHERQAANSPPK
jgi:arylsulfatase A-like enzyme